MIKMPFSDEPIRMKIDPAKVVYQGSGGSAPTIGENGNWYIDGVDTGKPSRGEQGPAGPQGETGPQGEPGEDYTLTEADKTDIAEEAAAALAGTSVPTPATAAVGQIVKVKAVDADGKITQTEAVDMPGGELKWFEVADMTLEEDVTDLRISTDKDGNAISGYNALAMVLSFVIPADPTQTNNNGNVWVYPFSNGTGTTFRWIAGISNWKTIERGSNTLFAGTSHAMFMSGLTATPIAKETILQPFDGVRLYVQATGDHLPKGTKVRLVVLSRGGGTHENMCKRNHP